MLSTQHAQSDNFVILPQSQQITKRLFIVGDSIIKNIEPYKMKKKYKIRCNGKIDSWSNNRGNDPAC